jgi:hypothetical protein
MVLTENDTNKNSNSLLDLANIAALSEDFLLQNFGHIFSTLVDYAKEEKECFSVYSCLSIEPLLPPFYPPELQKYTQTLYILKGDEYLDNSNYSGYWGHIKANPYDLRNSVFELIENTIDAILSEEESADSLL